MSYYTLKIKDSDISFDQDNRLETINEVSQSFKIYLETQYESDFRDPNYGFKLQELIQSTYSNKEELLRLYVVECLTQHPRTKQITELQIEKIEDRKYRVNVTIELKSEEEIEIESVINV